MAQLSGLPHGHQRQATAKYRLEEPTLRNRIGPDFRPLLVTNVISFRPPQYEALAFRSGQFVASGTLCGCVDFTDGIHTWCLTVPELDSLVRALQAARNDVVANSRPFSDARIRPTLPPDSHSRQS